jgi:hypothetical protein
VPLPLLVLLVALGEALGFGDLFQVLGRLALVAGEAYRCQPLRVVGVLVFVAQAERRPVIEDKEAEDEPGAAIRTAALLAQHDLGFQPLRQVLTLTDLKRPLAHRDLLGVMG